MSIRIVLADDHRLIRQGLRALLEKEPDLEVVGEAADGRSALQMVSELTPHIVIVDIGMPALNGIEVARLIASGNTGAKVIALSMHSDRRFVAEMFRAGASGYLLKDSAFDELVLAIRTVSAGKVYLSPQVADVVVEDYLNRPTGPTGAPTVFARLTAREREVLQLMAEGLSTKQIALSLSVSVKTVETHRRQIMEKLGIYSVAELTKYAIREGLTPLER